MVLAAALACAPADPAADPRTPAGGTDSAALTDRAPGALDAGAVEPIACEGLESSLLPVPATRAALRDRFGAPDSIRATTEPNRHVAGATDSLFVVYYPGLLISLRTPSGGRDMADRVEVTDGRYVRHAALRIGAPAAQVLAALGTPNTRDATRLVYDCGEGAEQPVTFTLQHGVVAAITIDYYVD